jgi:hypothetical protein
MIEEPLTPTFGAFKSQFPCETNKKELKLINKIV